GPRARPETARDLPPGCAAAGVASDHSAARQFSERALEDHVDRLGDLDGGGAAPWPDPDAAEVPGAGSLHGRGHHLSGHDHMLGLRAAPHRGLLRQGLWRDRGPPAGARRSLNAESLQGDSRKMEKSGPKPLCHRHRAVFQPEEKDGKNWKNYARARTFSS